MKAAFEGEKWVARQIWNRIHVQNTNAIVGVFGLPGTGKTYTAVRIAELVDRTFNLGRVVFTVPDFLRLRNGPPHLPRGSAILFDDTSRGANSRKWQTPMNQALADVANTFRFEGYLVLCTARISKTMDSQFRDLFHLTLEVKGRDMATRKITTKPMIPSMDTARGKTYWHYPRVLVPGSNYCVLKRVRFSPSRLQTGPHLTWTAYEQAKAAFMRRNDRSLERELRLAERVGGRVPKWALELLRMNVDTSSQRAVSRKIHISQAAISQLLAPSVDLIDETG